MLTELKNDILRKQRAGYGGYVTDDLFDVKQDVRRLVATLARFGYVSDSHKNVVTDLAEAFKNDNCDHYYANALHVPVEKIRSVKAGIDKKITAEMYLRFCTLKNENFIARLNKADDVEVKTPPRRIWHSEKPENFRLDFANYCRELREYHDEFDSARDLFVDRGLPPRSVVKTFEETGLTNNTSLERWREIAEAYDALKITDVQFGERLLEVLEYQEMTLDDLVAVTRPRKDQWLEYIENNTLVLSAFVRMCCALDISPYEFFEREEVYLED